MRTIVASGARRSTRSRPTPRSLEQGARRAAAAPRPGRALAAPRAEPLLRRGAARWSRSSARLAPDLTRAFDESGPSVGAVTRESVRVIEGLVPLRQAAEPVLRKAAPR